MSELNCGARGYKGLRAPTCRSGRGCVECWKIYTHTLEKEIKELKFQLDNFLAVHGVV